MGGVDGGAVRANHQATSHQGPDSEILELGTPVPGPGPGAEVPGLGNITSGLFRYILPKLRRIFSNRPLLSHLYKSFLSSLGYVNFFKDAVIVSVEIIKIYKYLSGNNVPLIAF